MTKLFLLVAIATPLTAATFDFPVTIRGLALPPTPVSTRMVMDTV